MRSSSNAEGLRTGLRDVTPEDLVEMARAWAIINAGETPAEVAARLGLCARDNR